MIATSKVWNGLLYQHILGQFLLLGYSKNVLPRLTYCFRLVHIFYVMDLYFILLLFLQSKCHLRKL